MNNRLRDLYFSSLRSDLVKDLGLDNIFQAPQVKKIVINVGVKESVKDSKKLSVILDSISEIAGQRAVKTFAKKSVAGFKIREGMAIGARVTLRGKKMYNFLEKLIKLALPSVRDFRGLKASFDQTGSYNLGLKDWMIFPEVDYDKCPFSMGMNITFCIDNGGDKASGALLKGLGMPLIVA